MSAPVITLAMLIRAHACSEQEALFTQLYPDGVAVVTRENVAAAAAAGLQISWGSERFLRGKFKRAYIAAIAEPRKAYDAATAEAFADAYIAQCAASAS